NNHMKSLKTILITSAILLCSHSLYAADVAMPALPPLPSLQSVSSSIPDMPKLPDAQPATTASNEKKEAEALKAPPLELPPLLQPPAPAKKEEPKSVAKPSSEGILLVDNKEKDKPEKDKKDKKKSSGKKKSYAVRHKPTFENYRTEYLPDNIYKKSYDSHNLHLPIAYYNSDYNQMAFITAARDDINGLNAILATGKSINLTNEQGETILMVAVKNNAINVARLLLARKANPNIADIQGVTPIDVAKLNGNYQMLRAIEAMD
ncbi:MAG: ankyrin repeat domain-containing protein, partial [Pseudomonadota bacterium]